ncbi:MAG TPA: hypothetical protein VGX96_17505, partial [Candidatus Elarobacter sp.]|nr:hypothetical protein [Candidatus Elarobacter sp.]
MTRINFLIGWSERSIGIALPNTIPPALRLPVLALAAAIGLVILLFAVQAARLRSVEREGAAFDGRLSALDAEVARVRAVER